MYFYFFLASPKKPSSPQSNKRRPQEEGPPPYNPAPDMDRARGIDPRQKQAMQSPHNRSSPALNSKYWGKNWAEGKGQGVRV